MKVVGWLLQSQCDRDIARTCQALFPPSPSFTLLFDSGTFGSGRGHRSTEPLPLRRAFTARSCGRGEAQEFEDQQRQKRKQMASDLQEARPKEARCEQVRQA